MEYIKNTLDFQVENPTVITLGKFDGLHRGHELLMEALLNKSHACGWKSVVFTFDIPPRTKVLEEKAALLTTKAEKVYLFEQTGVDYLIECPFTEEVRSMDPAKFIEWIVKTLHIKCIVAGKDFRFGYNRAGDYHVLEKYAAVYGYETMILDKMQEDGRDISSTYIREELFRGHIEKVNHMLGYEFFVKSFVVHGKKIGRTIGIPTINMVFPEEKLLPPNGVYVTRVVCNDKWYQGVSNVGCKPTIGADNPIGVETYIIDFCQDLYDQLVEVHFLSYLRPEKKFASMEELKQQMQSDIAEARNYYRKIYV